MSEIEQKTVLVVDDVMPNRKLLNALLSRQGFNVLEAENGQQAVEMYQQHDDLYMIFMDVMMPVMDGNEATRTIKQLAGNRFIPIIMVTALDEHQGMAKGVEAGADDYLTKPIDAILLNSKLKAMQRIRDLHDLQEKQYKQLQAIQKRIDDEQRLAESILNAAIGNRKDSIPNLTSTVQPAELFSGDLVLQTVREDGSWIAMVSDFTGHGLPAAVGTVPVTDSYYTMSRKGLDARQILCELNYKLKNFLPVNMFMCCALLDYSPDSRQLTIWNGGMPKILVKDGNTGKVSQTIDSADVPLGIVEKSVDDFQFEVLNVNPGDAVVVFSDGLTEAENESGEQLGLDRLISVVEANPVDQLENSIVSDWQSFQAEGKQLDDVTLLTVYF